MGCVGEGLIEPAGLLEGPECLGGHDRQSSSRTVGSLLGQKCLDRRMEVVGVKGRPHSVLALADELLNVALEFIRDSDGKRGVSDLTAEVHGFVLIELLLGEQSVDLQVGMSPAQNALLGVTTGQSDEAVEVITCFHHGEVGG